MKIAICGIRGIPACYGGFETFAEELSSRLVLKGHQVVVYGRKHVIDFEGKYYKGVEIKKLWAPKHKYLETPVHSLICFFNLIFNKVDVVLVCNAANSPFVFILRLFGKKVAINVDGIERMRGKWNLLGRLWYRLGEVCSVIFANRIVADAEMIKDYYKKSFGVDSELIRYGSKPADKSRVEEKFAGSGVVNFSNKEKELFTELGVSPSRYVLYVSRLEPENNAHLVIEAYNKLPSNLKHRPLLIVGDAPYADDYKKYLKSIAGENVIFAGYRFGESYKILQLGAYIYVQATEVGGTHPALVESMGYANCVLANSTPEHLEVLGVTGDYYQKNNVADLGRRLALLLENQVLVKELREKAYLRAKTEFNWDLVTYQYECLFAKMTGVKISEISLPELDLEQEDQAVEKVANI